MKTLTYQPPAICRLFGSQCKFKKTIRGEKKKTIYNKDNTKKQAITECKKFTIKELTVLSQCDTGIVVLMFFSLEQQASTSLAPRINLVEDNFSMDQRQEMFWGRFKYFTFIVLLWESRQHIKNQRHYFVNKGSSSQGYGFSSSHVWMWEVDYKESWVQKNDVFELRYLRRLLRVPWTARRSNCCC